MKKNIQFLFSAFLVFALGACSNNGKDQPGDAVKKQDSIPSRTMIVNPNPLVDQSPMDMSYYPTEYPKLKMSGETNALPYIRVIYSRPQKKGRVIFGGLQKYGEPWRLGANEASEIEFFREVSIQGKKIPPGRYVIYCIPEENQWTIVLNTNLFSWGLHFDPAKDAYHFTIPVEKTKSPVEFFTMIFQKKEQGANLVMAWDNIMARLPIAF
ncbi:MAG: DUF2911 domain-containing protein [Terrimonas sp.]|nr:DUF2911 domain-containing protein [Terrimonas sp.]